MAWESRRKIVRRQKYGETSASYVSRSGRHRPLQGKRVLVTRSKALSALLAEELRHLGAVPIEFPTLEFFPPESFDIVDRAIRHLEEFDWVIFTGANGVHYFLNRMETLGLGLDALGRRKIASVGPRTKEALERRGLRVSFVPREYLTSEIARGLGEIKGKRILLPRADIASRELRDELRRREADVEEVVAYRTTLPTQGRIHSWFSGRDFWETWKPDYVTFTSASSVKNFITLIGEENLSSLPKNLKIACIGPITAAAARKAGLQVHIIAKEHTIRGLLEELVTQKTWAEEVDALA
jgi:uroporphyrinogen III methyltransferase/synthase